MVTPHWSVYLQAFLTPLIACIALYLAYSQWVTARNKLRFDLFEKRYAVYEGALNFVGAILSSGRVEDEMMSAYLVATRASKWVVGPEVGEYLEREIFTLALEMQWLAAAFDGLPAGDAHAANSKRRVAIMNHLNAQFKQLDSWFSAYLQLSH